MTAECNDDDDMIQDELPRKKPANKSKSRATAPRRSFEDAIAEVESIVARLEGGRLELAQSLDEYQRGIGTLKECYELLESAERRITLLSGFDAEGNPVTEPFEEQAMTIEEKQAARSSRRSTTKPSASRSGSASGRDSIEDDAQEGLF